MGDRMKLSLLVQAWRDRAPKPEGENKSYLAGQASAALCCADELEAALAQQAQPLTDVDLRQIIQCIDDGEPN
jgi:hypothetical protein